MPVLTADRDPGHLLAELERLIEVDWPAVWAGPPQDTGPRAHWCAGFGWRPLWSESGLRVRTVQGGRLHLVSRAPGHRVTRIDHTVWEARARHTDENARVTELTETRWHAHLDALRGFMGPPTQDSTWDATDFPELPGPAPWPDARWRTENRDPHRVAVWRFRTPYAPVIELRATLGATSRSGSVPADARIGLACHDAAHLESLRQARHG